MRACSFVVSISGMAQGITSQNGQGLGSPLIYEPNKKIIPFLQTNVSK